MPGIEPETATCIVATFNYALCSCNVLSIYSFLFSQKLFHQEVAFFFYILISSYFRHLSLRRHEEGDFLLGNVQSNWIFHAIYHLNRLLPFSMFKNLFLITCSQHLIFILLQRHISKLSKYFRSYFLSGLKVRHISIHATTFISRF